MTEQHINDLIRHALNAWREPDPHIIARRLFAKMTPEDRDYLALAGLTERVSLRRVSAGPGGNATHSA